MPVAQAQLGCCSHLTPQPQRQYYSSVSSRVAPALRLDGALRVMLWAVRVCASTASPPPLLFRQRRRCHVWRAARGLAGLELLRGVATMNTANTNAVLPRSAIYRMAKSQKPCAFFDTLRRLQQHLHHRLASPFEFMHTCQHLLPLVQLCPARPNSVVGGTAYDLQLVARWSPGV